ncbi:MAG: type II CRISPR RNA-guided endonuclease Cas9 [Clostridiales bacterium]|nr:type II CRISPR RNA-guided endonuclease Cas9 [Clostridiales bacterium]
MKNSKTDCKKDYYIGADLGTNSLGWAVTDEDYNVLKFNQKAMWGTRLFNESETAQDCRGFRTSRRRTDRRHERLTLLEQIFDTEICREDPSFFQRLKESNLYLEDKTSGCKYTVFDGDYTDKDFYAQYPTIYHLRKELIENKNQQYDVRLVYLAVHHIMKHRGHFLFDSLDMKPIDDFEPVYNKLVMYLKDNYDIEICCADTQKYAETLTNRTLTKKAKNDIMSELFGVTKNEPQKFACLSLINGLSVKLSDIFDDESLDEAEKNTITFSSGYSDKEAYYQSVLGERYELIEMLKAVYDWAILADILDGEQYISFAKVSAYEQHKKDLKDLKTYIKEYIPEKYNEVFKKSEKKLKNYVAYSGHIKESNSKTGTLIASCNQQDFCKYLQNILGKCKDDSYKEMFNYIESGTFMPKQRNAGNGVIPMQVHRAELVKILDNACSYLTFLNEKDSNGYTAYDKILSIFDYKIPYYVGPLNKHSDKAWLERTGEKIYPWNFEKVVNVDKSAENFIENLTSKCTYLPKEDVIPKNSILYSKYMVLNELNNIKLDSNDIDVSLKQDIFNSLFLKYNKVTAKKLRDYLHSRNIEFETLGGIDGDFKSSMKPYLDFERFDALNTDDKEEIIKAITIFGDDKKMLRRRLNAKFSDKLNQQDISKICRLKYSGWGNLSKEFLTQVESVYKKTGEVVNIITALWQTENNLMQLLYSEDFDFHKALTEMNSNDMHKTLKDMVDEQYVSPKVKRPIYQTLLVVKEIEKIQKCPPKKIFVEVARGGDGKKKHTVSRKTQLLDLYENCRKDNDELYQSLQDANEDDLRSDKLYLYYTQFGKCMYSGESIDLDYLMGSNSRWDIDHIYPQSKIKDDSLDNRVLVNKTINANKTNDFPISSEIQHKMAPFWKLLKGKGLISEEKYKRLTRTTQLTDDELAAFISRQLVETRQSTKAISNILEQLYPDTEIVYVKASLVSDFRHQYDMLKCREVNDFHHAKDAYLNIVVGNVYNVKVTHNKINFIKGLKMSGSQGYSLNTMFNYDIKGAWDAQKSIGTVKKTMAKNNILYTRYSFKQHGGLFDQQILKKGKGQVPIKAQGPRSDISKYGGYNKAMSTYFAYVEYEEKGKKIRRLVPIDAYREKYYCENPVKFMKDAFNIENAVILIPCIKYDSCISVDGFRMYLSSKTGAQNRYKPGMQLVLGYEKEKYLKNIVKYVPKYSSRAINSFDGIDVQSNISLYDLLCYKMKNTIFKVEYSDLGNKLINKRDVFVSLEPEKQCVVILEILKILHSTVESGNLKHIGEAKQAGNLALNSKLSKIKHESSVKLINQSVTGLFEQEIDLLGDFNVNPRNN